MSKKCRDLEIHIHTHQYIEALRDALYKYTTTTTTTTYIHKQTGPITLHCAAASVQCNCKQLK